jgi:hypothetical protein
MPLIEAAADDGKQPVACLKRVSDRWEHPMLELGEVEQTLSAFLILS